MKFINNDYLNCYTKLIVVVVFIMYMHEYVDS